MFRKKNCDPHYFGESDNVGCGFEFILVCNHFVQKFMWMVMLKIGITYLDICLCVHTVIQFDDYGCSEHLLQ